MPTTPSGRQFRTPPVLTGVRRRIGGGRIAACREVGLIVTGVPEDGDLVIRPADSGTAVAYLVRAVPGPDQLTCATRAEAEQVAGSYAAHAGVNVWLARTATAFTLVSRSRGSALERPRVAGRFPRHGVSPVALNA